LARARAALVRHDWDTAHRETAAAADLDDPADVAALLDARAEAAWWLGDLDACIEAREAAFAKFEETGDARGAGQCAVWLSEHYGFKGQPAIAGAWLRRARHRLGEDVDCVEYGNLVLREVEASHGRGELDDATRNARTIVELGRRLGSPDLEAQALQTLGRVMVDMGRPHEGLGYLDDAMLFALEGQLGPYATGKIYCSLISACEELGDVRRASEWTQATARWAERHPLALFPGLCRVHHAWALECRGEWAAAEAEVVRACVQLVGISRVHAAAGYAELGAIRHRLGDVDGAEAAFREAESLSGRPQAGLALLRLEQGKADAAAAIIERLLEDETWSRLARAKLLPLHVQIALAAGDVDGAARSADELSRIAEDFDNAAVEATAATAHGRVLLARGDARAACSELRRAGEQWRELQVPYEVATDQSLLAQAYRAIGDEHAASTAFAAAEAGFEALGAPLDLRATRLLRGGAALPGGLTAREVEVLRLVATGRTNREIAADLFLSEKTVARHLSNIFTKIGVASRAAATAYAFDQGIMSGRPAGG
jgi:ATP/maltotriose-dependent transcriptional regulator MalT